MTDDDGAMASARSVVTVSAAPVTEPMWVGGLTGTAAPVRNGWTATVTIGVADKSGPVAGVSVAGTWSAGSGDTSCITTGAGSCSVSSSTLGRKTTGVRFTVSGLTVTGWAYDSTRNVKTFVDVARP